ncbi:cold-shock protein [Telmatospirillum sp. J64-1]|uniref:cold-shock protein n=1 Tax=Telmatospirillum sp. J64-1 TaxID=2502183 RepID=UPI00115E74FD
MATGRLKWFNPVKGYGFILPDEGGRDVFVHASALQQSGLKAVNHGQRLEFETALCRAGRVTAVRLAALDQPGRERRRDAAARPVKAAAGSSRLNGAE